MALTLDEIQALTKDYWYPGAHENYYKANVLMYRLLKNGGMASGGVKLRVPIAHGEPRGGAFGETTTFDTTRRDDHNAARYDWAYYYEPITYGMKDKVQNAGPEQQVDAVMSKLNRGQKAIRDNMADDVYDSLAQGAVKPLTGLQSMINATSSTAYGEISEDDLAVWTPGVVDTTSEALTLPVMRSLKRSCKVGSAQEDKPTIYITTDELRDSYEALLQPQQRFTDPGLAKAGFENLAFDTKPVVGDTKCPSGFMFALNENHLDFKSHRNFKFHHEPWMRPTDQYLFTMQIIWVGNLVCKRRDAHGSHSNLT